MDELPTGLNWHRLFAVATTNLRKGTARANPYRQEVAAVCWITADCLPIDESRRLQETLLPPVVVDMPDSDSLGNSSI